LKFLSSWIATNFEQRLARRQLSPAKHREKHRANRATGQSGRLKLGNDIKATLCIFILLYHSNSTKDLFVAVSGGVRSQNGKKAYASLKHQGYRKALGLVVSYVKYSMEYPNTHDPGAFHRLGSHQLTEFNHFMIEINAQTTHEEKSEHRYGQENACEAVYDADSHLLTLIKKRQPRAE
jgi:hypothetical protein